MFEWGASLSTFYLFQILQCFNPCLFHKEKFEKVHVGYIPELTNSREVFNGYEITSLAYKSFIEYFIQA